MDISNLARTTAMKLNRHTPMALTILASLGVIATAYTAHQAGVKATQKIVTTEIELGEMISDPRDKLKIVWKHYIAPLSIGMATVACIAAGQAVNMKRQAAIMGAYALGERAFTAYKDKMIEQLGEEQEEEIRKQSIVDHALKIQEDEPYVIEEHDVTEDMAGKALFIDTFSGQQFITELENVYKAMNATNKRCAEDGYVPMNYFYSIVGARKTELGEVFGWNTDRMMDLTIVHVSKGDSEKESNIMDVYGIEYRELPVMEYQRVWN